MVEGHRRTDVPWRLNARAFTAMTGVGAVPAVHRQESRRHLALGTPGRRRTGRRDETSRNVVRSDIEACSYAGLVDHCTSAASLGALLISTTGAMDASDFDPTRILYDD